jgi:hypothetical protein
LVTTDRRTVLLRIPEGNSNVEAVLSFVHVYWSPDETKVGVLGAGLAMFRLAADVASGNSIPFSTIENQLSQSIRETYHLSETIRDPLQWAAMADASIQFSKRKSEIR